MTQNDQRLWRAVAPLLDAWYTDVRKADPDHAADVERLLTKRDGEPGLEPALLAKTVAHGPSRRLRAELIDALVQSIVHEGGFHPKTHALEGRQDDTDPRTRQRFYTEDFPTLFPSLPSGRMTKRTSIVNPAFHEQDPRLTSMGEAAFETATSRAPIDKPHASQYANLARLTDPTTTEDLLKFKQEVAQALRKAGTASEASPGAAVLAAEVRRPGNILPMMHAHVTGIVAAFWFRSRWPSTRAAWLAKTHAVVRTPEAAAKAFLNLVEFYGDAHRATVDFEEAAAPFVVKGSWEYGAVLLTAMLQHGEMDDRIRGATLGNLGACLRRGDRRDDARQCLEASVQFHERAHDLPGLAIAARDLAEHIWHEEPDEAERLVQDVQQVAARLDGKERDAALFQLVAMFQRLNLPDHEAAIEAMRTAVDS